MARSVPLTALLVALLVLAAGAKSPKKAPAQWQPKIDAGSFLYEVREPKNFDMMTSVGNGYVATVIGSDTVYMSGVYNGLNTQTPSHRAKIPSVNAVSVTNPNVTHSGCGIDLQEGVYYRHYKLGNVTVEMRWYAHRTLRSLLVMEMTIDTSKDALPVTLLLSQNTSASADFNITTPKNVSHDILGVSSYSATIVTPEQPGGDYVEIGVVGDVIPANISVESNSTTVLYFITAFRSSLELDDPLSAALADYQNALAVRGTLMTSHIEGWNQLWASRIAVSGNDVKITQVTNSAQYYILSSVRSDWPWSLSPGSLSSNGYNGHVFWDAETWMYPAVLLTNPEIALGGILQYRVNHNKGAARKARSYNPAYDGYMYPWESAYSGDETCPVSASTGILEQHITGDIAFALRQYWQLTNDTNWLDQNWFIILDIGKFWASRVTYNNATKAYEIIGVTPPDEYAVNISNSAYTNAVAKISLDFAISTAQLLNKSYPPTFQAISNGLRIPEDSEKNIHLEYDGYNGSKIKQADVVLLGFPLMFPMTKERRRSDLVYYANRTDRSGPAMTWAMHVIAWLELKEYAEAAKLWNITWANAKLPFGVWTETPSGGTTNFITGAGGFLQSILFGYGGIRLESGAMHFNPQLPPNVTSVSFGRIHYLGNDMSVSFESSTMTIMKTNSGGTLLEFGYNDDEIHDVLTLNVPIQVSRGPFRLLPTRNRLFWGFPLRFWIVFGALALVGVVLAIGIGCIVRKRVKPATSQPATHKYKPIPEHAGEI